MKPYYSHAGIEIYHGDCRDVLPLLPTPDLVLTDPPYGVGLSDMHFGRSSSSRRVAVCNDDATHVGQAVLDALARRPTIAFASPQLAWAGEWDQWLVWDKGSASGGGGDVTREWFRSWELVQVRNLGVLHGKRESAVLRFPKLASDRAHHVCQKPLALLTYLLSKVDAACVLDPFMGSGSTLVAAKQLGKRAIGIEVEERYCEIAANRLSQEVLALV